MNMRTKVQLSWPLSTRQALRECFFMCRNPVRVLAGQCAIVLVASRAIAQAQEGRVVAINARYAVTVPESWSVLANNRMDRLKAVTAGDLSPRSGLVFQANSLNDDGQVIGQVQIHVYPSSGTTQEAMRNMSSDDLSAFNDSLRSAAVLNVAGFVRWFEAEMRSVNGVVILRSGYERKNPEHSSNMQVSRYGILDREHSFALLFSWRSDHPELEALSEAIIGTMTTNGTPGPLKWTSEVEVDSLKASRSSQSTSTAHRLQWEADLRALIVEVNALGSGSTLSEVGLEIATPERATADFRAMQSLFNEDSFPEAFLALYEGLGMTAPGETVGSRLDMLFDNPFDGRTAYYDHSRQAIVVRAELLAAESDPGRILLHELGHAKLDRLVGIESYCRAGDRTWDGAKTLRSLLEGYAELIAVAVVARREGLDLAEGIDMGLLRVREGASAVGSAPYLNGLRLLIADYRSGGWDAVNSRLLHRVASSEQLLHAEKRASDQPSQVPIPYRLLEQVPFHSDTVGEIGIELILLSGGATEAEATIASVGWDGDALHVYSFGKEVYGCIWRSVWDREMDAKQFVECAVGLSVRGDFSIRGRVVDWSCGTTPALAEVARVALAMHPVDAYTAINPEDAASTSVVERNLESKLLYKELTTESPR